MTQWFRCVSLRNRVSLPLARKFVMVANKRIGGELLILHTDWVPAICTLGVWSMPTWMALRHTSKSFVDRSLPLPVLPSFFLLPVSAIFLNTKTRKNVENLFNLYFSAHAETFNFCSLPSLSRRKIKKIYCLSRAKKNRN